ncbi:MAG: MFS transporter [Gammaproteobacteria bacterium]|nr:MFS transporter [Gammaproteobacteria bacterium]
MSTNAPGQQPGIARADLDPVTDPIATTSSDDRTTRRDMFTIGLVGTAHGMSHFMQLTLPPLFPFIAAEFGASYTQLGLIMTTFFVASGIGQPLAGVLVDRIGARQVLFAGLFLYALSVLVYASVGSFWMFYPIAVFAGLGNCVFHPVDFSILNASVRERVLGRAFSVHTLGGNLGWAAAPTLMLVLAGVIGWRGALMVASGMAFVMLFTLWLNRELLRDDRPGKVAGRSGAAPTSSASLLTNPALLMCFGFFLLLAAALIGIQNFLPPILKDLHQTPLALSGAALTGFLLGAALGVIVGGIVADRSRHHGAIITAGLCGSGIMLVLVAQLDMGAALLVGTVGLAGFLSGLTTPSRDLVVRSVTPPGATGRVFGYVYSGLDVGSALAPTLIGVLLDTGQPRLALWLVAGLFIAGVLTVVSLRSTHPPRARAA